jgi:hypothetical protein
MKRRKRTGVVLLLIAAAVALALHWGEDRGPVYNGRHIADWVDLALDGNVQDREAENVVVAIGAPAVPFIARKGLHDRCHTHPYLNWDRAEFLCDHHPWIGGLAVKIGVLKLENCVLRHELASGLLGQIGTNAQAAIPDLIDCLKHCPNPHYFDTQDWIDLLGDISGTNRAALPYLTYLARQDDSFSLRSAAVAFSIDGDTNLVEETCQRVTKRDPAELAQLAQLVLDRGLWWLQSDELNLQLVPLLKQRYSNPSMDAEAKECLREEIRKRTGETMEAEDATGPRD